MTTPPNGQGWNEPGQPGNQPPGYGQGGQQPPYGGGGQPPYGGGGGQPPYGGGSQPPYGGGYPGSPGGASAGDAFTWGWNAFTRNAAPFVLAMLAYGGLLVVVGLIMFFALFGSLAAAGESTGGLLAVFSGAGVFFIIVVWLLIVLMQAGMVRGSLDVADGKPISVGTFFQFADLGKVMLTILLLAAGSLLGSLAFGIGAAVFGWIAQFTLFYVIGQGQSPIDGLKSSYALVRANMAETALLYILVAVAGQIGAALCFVGMLVAVPLGMLATAFMFRRLQGQPVAA